jgi:nucleoside recognition membrane protein YjiH
MLKFLIKWLILVLLFVVMGKFEGTRTILYYTLWLTIVLLLIASSDEISAALGTSSGT